MDPYPFPAPEYRFEHRNDLSKCWTWAEEFVTHGKRLYTQSRSSIRPSLALTQKHIVPKLYPFKNVSQCIEIRAVMP